MWLPIPGTTRRLTGAVCFLLAAQLYATPEQVVREVRVEGNLRAPAATILRHISLSPGSRFDPAAVRRDLSELRSLGIFENIVVDTREAGENRIDAVFRVKELPFVSAFVIEGLGSGLEAQLYEHLRREKIEVKPSRPYQPVLAQRAARYTRGFLQARGYPQPSVEVVQERRGAQVRVVLKAQPGPRMRIGKLAINGNVFVSADEIRKQMQSTRAATFWNRWSRAGAYIPEELSADLERVRRYYQSRGFASARIGPPAVKVINSRSRRLVPPSFGANEEEKLVIEIPVVEGPRFRLASVRVEGDTKSAADEVLALTTGIQAPCDYDRELLEETRRRLVSALGRRGYALAQVRLDLNPSVETNALDAVYTIDAGDPVEVGIIRFEGNSRLPEKFLRKELVMREAEVFDSSRLDKSIERLNHSSLVHEVRREDVSLSLDPERNALDITFKLKEKDRRGIFATGGTGGITGGYLGVIYTAFNLLGLGDALTLELDGGAAQSNVLVNLVASRFLGSPFALALSGFHRYMNLNVASLVPGPEDLLSVFRRRSSGIGLSGAYTVRANCQLGLGYQVERESFSGVEEPGVDPGGAAENIRGELTPLFVFDSTKDSGPSARGTRLIMSNALIGSPSLSSIHAVRPSLFYSRYINDPWTAGRNSFSLRVQGGTLRPLGGNSLPLDMRYFPGDEMVRGFRRGSLSPWVHDPEVAESLRPLGADTVLGISAEYRVPLRGALSSAAFVDLGWTRLGDLGKIDNLNNGTRLIEDTDRLLRASAGGELRLQLPVIRQPARLIFAWNPLRLDRVVQGAASPMRLVDPRGAIRFALGNIF